MATGQASNLADSVFGSIALKRHFRQIFKILVRQLSISDVTDTFDPFNLSDEPWKFVVKKLDSNLGSGLFVDSVSLSNVPIPGAVWLLGVGLIGLAVVRKKNNYG